ncbi:protein arginine n-methyltransferase 3 [Anaeramoeba flamelloides]|uniref:type I protein arginine methyltransferase n=1 Tax=Anaeramoeba flamelloides TaxID=1746091 RepID=A0AAV7YG77_9EUKA|nr:protein arginine n-methyltransferase [Anaeramoeba flamelloides]KAJ6252047.1 protein arginine n-methyltransferase 3 [Anaeramoeba flamelloides]
MSKIENEKETEKKTSQEENKSLHESNLSFTSKDFYFEAYAHIGSHEDIIRDSTFLNSFKRAILDNPQIFKDKVVMDVGCGIGILSLMAAKAGAKKVIGIDHSKILLQTNEIIKENGFSDTITLINSKVEDVEKLPEGIEEVDVIISDWMGYGLFYEHMLQSVIFARDKWLKEGGIMMPDQASLYISGALDPELNQNRINFWDNVYGFQMKSIKPLIPKEPLIAYVSSDYMVSDPGLIKKINLVKIDSEDIEFETDFQFEFSKQNYFNTFVLYFTYGFNYVKSPFNISTSPYYPMTHWKQTILYLDEMYPVFPNEIIKGTFKHIQDKKRPKDLLVSIKYQLNGKICKKKQENYYRLK